MIRCSWTKSAI